MESDISLEDMAKEIKELEAQLTDMKKAYREKRMAGLKSAMEARKSADEAVRDELECRTAGCARSRGELERERANNRHGNAHRAEARARGE